MTETSSEGPARSRAARALRAGIGAGGTRVEEEDDTEEDDRLVVLVLLPLWILIPPVAVNGIVLLNSKCSENGGSDEFEGAERFLKCAIWTLNINDINIEIR